MTACDYVYCRAPFDPALNACPACGFPTDKSRLHDAEFLERALPPIGLPSLIDMHQIIPAADGMFELQLRLMGRLAIRKVLLQSAPPQATSLWGDERLAQLAATHPGRFWISQFVDPRHPGAIGRLHECVARRLKVIKLLPCAGYEPDDPGLEDFWQAMDDRRLVAMVHTGFITARHQEEERRAGTFLSSKYGNPLFLDVLARKFPHVQIILCHLGDALWYEEAAQMVTQHENVWGDVSGFGLFALKRVLRNQVAIDWRKVFWGNDAPAYAYPFNLRLLHGALEQAGAEGLAAPLLHDNAEAFGARFLE